MGFVYEIIPLIQNCGEVRGHVVRAACMCTFTPEGIGEPCMLKIQNEEGEIETIQSLYVISKEKKCYAGQQVVEFVCSILLQKVKMTVKLLFFVQESRWILVYL